MGFHVFFSLSPQDPVLLRHMVRFLKLPRQWFHPGNFRPASWHQVRRFQEMRGIPGTLHFLLDQVSSRGTVSITLVQVDWVNTWDGLAKLGSG
jgi:hypothetical protein